MEYKTNEVVDGLIQVGYEYELTDFLLMATQDGLNANASMDSDVTLFSDDEIGGGHSRKSSVHDGDIAGDAIDAALSATSVFAGWINEPVKGCYSGDYGRATTPNEADELHDDILDDAEDQRELSEEEEAKRMLGAPSWRDVITDQILVGLGLRQMARIEGKHDYSVSADTKIKEVAAEVPLVDVDKPESEVQETTDRNVPAEVEEPENSKHENENAEVIREELSEVAKEDTEHEMGQTSNGAIEHKTAQDVSVDTVGDLQEPRGMTAPTAAGSVETEGTSSPEKGREGKKNDVLKKLVAKCLVRNKKSGTYKEPAKKLQLEPESCTQYPNPETSFIPDGGSAVSESDMQSIEVVSREAASIVVPESREPCASSDNMASRSASRDPPASPGPHSSRPQSMKLRMNTTGKSATAMSSVQTPTNTHRRREQNSMELIMKRSTRTPDYYSQPPRPEVPFSKKSSKRPSSRQTNDEDKSETAKMTPFKESVLSSSALLRRRHYKEMLLRERAAQKTAVE